MGCLRKVPYARCLCIQVDIARLLDQYSRGYTRQTDGKLTPSSDQLPWRGTPAGGGVTTADDEVRFVEALKAGKLIPLPMLSEAIKQQTDWYGYGFISSGPTGEPRLLREADKEMVWRRGSVPYKWISTSWKINC